MQHVSHALRAILVTACLAPITSSFAAQELHHPYVGVRVTATAPDSDRFRAFQQQALDYHRGPQHPGIGIQVAAPLTEHWWLRSYFDRVRLQVADGPNAWGHTYGTDALYHWASGAYAGVGINHTRMNVQRNPMVRGSLGYRFTLRDRFFVTTEANLQGNRDWFDQQLSVSLNYQFGRDFGQQTLPRTFHQRRQQRLESPPAANDSAQVSLPPEQAEASPTPSSGPIGMIRFEFDSDQLTHSMITQQLPQFTALKTMLEQSPNAILKLIGHTDLTGSASYNDSLALRRAQAVADLLRDYGIDTARMRVQSMGAKAPLIDDKGAQPNAINRRVEIQLIQAG